MENYRLLRDEEIQVLEQNGCWAEDWERVLVDEALATFVWEDSTSRWK